MIVSESFLWVIWVGCILLMHVLCTSTAVHKVEYIFPLIHKSYSLKDSHYDTLFLDEHVQYFRSLP